MPRNGKLVSRGFLALVLAGAVVGTVPAAEYRPFLGTLHDHTGVQGDDGKGTFAEAFQAAREAGYDFFALSPHGHMTSEAGFRDLVSASQSEDRAGSFVVFPSFEWGTISKGGHVGVVASESLCTASGGQWDSFWGWRQQKAAEALVILNHPVWNRGFGGAPDAERVRQTALMEVIGGPSHWEGAAQGTRADIFHEDYLHSLNQGWRTGVAAGEDDHTGRWGQITRIRTGVWAETLDRDHLMAAFQARRTFATEDPGMRIWIEVDQGEMGAVLPWREDGNSYRLRYRVEHDSETISQVAVYADLDGVGGERASERTRTGSEGELELAPGRPGSYVLVVGRDSSGDLIWSSPIWFGEGEGSLSVKEELGGGQSRAPDPNFDDLGQLMEVPGLGKGTAKKILQARKEGVVFLQASDLRKVGGVDAGTWDRILAGLLLRTPEQHLDLLQELVGELGSLVMTEARQVTLEAQLQRLEELLARQLESLLLSGEVARAREIRQRLANLGEEYQEIQRGIERRLRGIMAEHGQADRLTEFFD